jgi:hypothetical protein
MIFETAAKCAIEIADDLEASGLYARAKPSTPMAALVNAVTIPGPALPQSEPVIYDYGLLMGMTDNFGARDRGETPVFELEMAALASQIGKAVSDHFMFARTVAKPLIMELATAIVADMGQLEVNPHSDVQVVEFDIPDFLKDAGMLEEIKRVQSDKFSLQALPMMAAPDLTIYEIVTQIGQFGAGNKEIALWLNGLTPEFLEGAWRGVFQSDVGGVGFHNTEVGKKQVDLCIFTYALSFTLAADIPDGITVSLGQWKSDLTVLRQQSARLLALAIDEFEVQKETKSVHIRRAGKDIVVNAAVLREFEEQGLTRAVLIANAMQERPYIYASAIVKNISSLQAMWDSFVGREKLRLENDRLRLFVDSARRQSLKLVTDNFEKVYEHLGENAVNNRDNPAYLAFLETMRVYTGSLKLKAVENVNDVAHVIICNCLFPHTACDQILDGISEAMSQNQGANMEVKEAALYSKASYIVDFLLDQVDLVSI